MSRKSYLALLLLGCWGTPFPRDGVNRSSPSKTFHLYCSRIPLGQCLRNPSALGGTGEPGPRTHLSVTEPGHGVHVLLLDHEGGQVGCVAGEKDDGKEGPHQNHDLAGGAPRILHRHRVVEHQGPQQPDGFPNGEGRASRACGGPGQDMDLTGLPLPRRGERTAVPSSIPGAPGKQSSGRVR